MSVRTIGIIAGSGIYPQTFIDAARAQPEELKLVVAGFTGETSESLATQVEAMEWCRVGQLSKVIKFFKKEGVTEAVMMGQIAPKNLFDLRPDLRVIKLLARTKKKNAESLFGGIAEELKKDGIEVLPAITFLENQMPAEGHFAGPSLDESQIDDAQYGFKIAKEVSRLDIGQSVVVRNGTVLAVEAFEGTNACIRRGGEQGKGKGVTLAKVSKPNQDFRFDVPVIGTDTVKNCAKSGVEVIAIEAGKTLILSVDEVKAMCAEHQISMLAITSES
ncbi:MAG: LpxI family protein [Akkermansiaceae bacterium]